MSKKFLTAAVSLALVGSAAAMPGIATAGPDSDTTGESSSTVTALKQKYGLPFTDQVKARPGTSKAKRPQGPNPYLALLENPSKADFAAWDTYLAQQSERENPQAKTLSRPNELRRMSRPPLVVDEAEPDGTLGSNETYQTAEPIKRFGTGKGDRSTARILGQTDNGPADYIEAISPNVEDDGSIPKARNTGVGRLFNGITTSGRIGDGPFGSDAAGTGDFDVYKVRGAAGQLLLADVDSDPSEGFNSLVLVFDSDGNFIDENDDDVETLDSRLVSTLPKDGDYFVFVAGLPSFPVDPFDSSSGIGAESEGDYELKLSVSEADVDTYAVSLEVGDVLGLSIAGSVPFLEVQDSTGTVVQGSGQDVSFIYPSDSPLPGGGNAVSDHVVDEAGMHYISVRGEDGRYDVTAEVYRPGGEGERIQTLYLDFDGARLNTNIFGGPGVRTLSPMRSYLGRWGLTNKDYEPLAREVISTVTENVKRDLRRSGIDPDTQIRFRNSLDHRDTFGQREDVSRIIIGGSINESGIETIGIAQSIDPGNFDQSETALVLLDTLSEPAVANDASLNFYLTPDSDRVEFIGTAIGNVVSHEAGHYFGNWHVDQFNDTTNLMDQGGNFAVLYGVGDDGIGGTADDPDVDFGKDEFNPNEGFTGTENTLGRLAAALVE